MLHITGGRVTFGRTVKTGDYENKKAEYTLDFNFGEDDVSTEELIAMAGDIAMRRCHAVLGLKVPGDVPGTAIPKVEHKAPAAAEVMQAPAAPPADDAPKKKPGRPVGSGTKVKLTPPPAEANPANAEIEHVLGAPADDDLLSMPADDVPAVKEISDKALMEAIVERNKDVANPPAIKKLAAEHGAQQGQQMTSIPQEKRAAFLAALKLVKPLA